jgi:hypothetical protein
MGDERAADRDWKLHSRQAYGGLFIISWISTQVVVGA